MKKEGENDFEGKERLFALCDCVFHPHPPPFQSIMPQLFFLRSHTHHTTQACLCAVLFLSSCVTVSALIPHSINTTPCNYVTRNTTQPTGDDMREYERAVIEDTTHDYEAMMALPWSHWLHGLGMHTRHNTTRARVT